MTKETFFIREDYRLNPVKTFNDDGIDDYWSEQRLEQSKVLQYHVYELAAKEFKKRGLSTVIDFGSGPGLKMKEFFIDTGLTSDISFADQPTTERLISRFFPNAPFYGGDFEDPNFSTGRTYDMVICSDVIEHVERPDILLELLKNHTSENGIMVISTPDRDMRRGIENLQSPNSDHVREWNRDEFVAFLEYSGLHIVNQINLPNIRLENYQKIFHRILHRKIYQTTWYPCQTYICTD